MENINVLDYLNLDCATMDELYSFINFVGNGVKPAKAAKVLFPNKEKGFIRITKDLRNYAWNQISARNCRIAGKIQEAGYYESICDKIYEGLPEFVKW